MTFIPLPGTKTRRYPHGKYAMVPLPIRDTDDWEYVLLRAQDSETLKAIFVGSMADCMDVLTKDIARKSRKKGGR